MSTPDNVILSTGCDGPSILVTWGTTGTVWTDTVTEIFRVSCRGTERVAVVDGASGTYCDPTIPLIEPGFGCSDDSGPCTVYYHLRHWGITGGVVTQSAYVDSATQDTVTNPSPGTSYLRGDDVTIACCPTESWSRIKPVARFGPIPGGFPVVTTGDVGGRVYSLVIPTVGITNVEDLEDMLALDVIYYQPALREHGWYAPSAERVNIPGARFFSYAVTLTETTSPVPDPADGF
jgi:hypothetical protein